ncbi:MAG: TIGR03905 family TSCPD domain-containing protein [Bacilli bacterium]|jgi:uncharacterized protein (TIGR03905 family)|nr:TIGR03905 family TSCPD domain-containing protein [Bacilli bacterium]
MDKTINYKTHGTCSVSMTFVIDSANDTIKDFSVIGGCNGNLKGIKALIIGMKAQDVISKLNGIRCGLKSTSCPDQIAKALEGYLAQKA